MSMSPIELACTFQLLVDHRLAALHLLDFNWTLKMIGLCGHLTIWAVLLVSRVISKTLFQRHFFQNIWISKSYIQKVFCVINKISVNFQTASRSHAPFHQMFSWTSVRSLKCSIYKMVRLQSQMTTWAVPWVPHVISKVLFRRHIFRNE